VELGPPLRRLSLGAFVVFMMACAAPVPSFEPDNIRLPPRDLREVDAGADASATPTNENPSAPDAGTDPGEPADPCAAPNLVACFAFEDSVSDAKGKLVPSELTGVAFVTGKSGKAARLGTGGGSRVRFNASDAIATAETTVEAWIRLDPTFSTEAAIFHADKRIAMTVEEGRTLLCASPGGAARGNLVALDKWVHVACVFGGGGVTAFVDGIAGQVYPFTAMPPAAPTLIELGSDPPDGTRPLSGAIDTLRIFSVARKATDIAKAAKP
jgi:hypothetical protein